MKIKTTKGIDKTREIIFLYNGINLIPSKENEEILENLKILRKKINFWSLIEND